eukprot:757500-Hanusia_phi.AAC.3
MVQENRKLCQGSIDVKFLVVRAGKSRQMRLSGTSKHPQERNVLLWPRNDNYPFTRKTVSLPP